MTYVSINRSLWPINCCQLIVVNELRSNGPMFSISEDIPEWEKELDAELQEYEVVNDGDNMVDDADLENEILQQIEDEANGSK